MSTVMGMQNCIRIYQEVQGIAAVSLFFQNSNLNKTSTYPKYHLTISLATSCQYQCLCKIHHNVLHSSRDRTIFTFFRIWTSAKPCPIPNVIWQFHWLHLVNINMYAKLHQNILHSSRDRVIFYFFRIGSSAKPRPIKMSVRNLLS